MKEYTEPLELLFGGRSCPCEMFCLAPKMQGIEK